MSVAGAVVVMAGLRDLFHTIWHPTRRGGLSRLVMTALWRLSRHLPARWRVAGLVGPLGMVAVMGTWALAIILGWALIYWPHMPESFAFAAGPERFERADLLDALYLSLVTVTTLGLGDIAPTAWWLRVAAPLESLVGFVLLTATVAWVLETYPALARRRALAIRLALLSRTDPSMRQLGCALGASLLESLATEVVRVRVDFTQYTETYYFHDGEKRTSLAVTVHCAADLAEYGQTARRRDVRLTAAMLAAALDDLATVLDQLYLRTGGSRKDVLAAYAADHGQGLGAGSGSRRFSDSAGA
ncbi:potassium channel family protein [Streptomyces sp. NPDC004647]|uniref:potassium channel family protein n=1 Tax=Streptomyces sp. NPDC004647 TaxID=3154671 RepID=UPI0033B1ED01